MTSKVEIIEVYFKIRFLRRLRVTNFADIIQVIIILINKPLAKSTNVKRLKKRFDVQYLSVFPQKIEAPSLS